MPTLAASWITGQGVSSRSSHSAAAGRMTSVANWCTQSRTSITSSLSCSENVTALLLKWVGGQRRLRFCVLRKDAERLVHPRLEVTVVIDVAGWAPGQRWKGCGV